MRLVRMGFIVIVAVIGYASTILAQEISIDQIIADAQISGFVQGLKPNEYANYKVVVYVETDRWYIHPYAGQGENRSWASITENGAWQIQTVRRQFSANKVAAVLVKRDYPEPNRTENILNIPHRAIVIRELRGTEEYGRL
ncbi:MAG: hypothetical protein ETSY1_23830 [Candidatus Entotheonella factor]|uniref:Uncharacterized protein n=1 Tax=Entotheonella factor TaxID=1429438 RepID=W4LGC5_ENTF1|nr:MAG: hypothetical protein ETSY1_23830 [Candidatus Entotheonella factor]